MSYPPGILRSCYEADGRSDRSGGSGDTGSGNGFGKFYGSNYGAFSDCNWHQQTQNHNHHHQTQQTQPLLSHTQSAWQKWAASFDALLSDGEGVALFKSFLESENCGNLLDFWFAVQGFRSKVDPSDRKKILQLIKVIYQTYIRGSTSVSTNGAPPSSASRNRCNHNPVRLRPETRRLIADRLAHKSSLDQTVFDDGQNEAGQVLRTTAYQAFLKSDIFIAHVQQGGSRSKPPSGPSEDEFAVQKAYLPTVEEDRELGQPALSLKDGITPSTYHYFCGPPMQHQQCTCQSMNPWSGACYSPAPLTQENIQMTRFQRAELPVPQHLSCCPHCQTPVQHQQQQQVPEPTDPLSPAHYKSIWRISGAGQRKWMDAVCPKYDYYPSPLPTQGGFARAPPNPYHISFAPVSMQESEHHSLSSGAHTEENLSHTDGVCSNELRSRLHRSSLRHKSPRMPPNYPVLESPAVTSPNFAISTSGRGGTAVVSHKHKRGVSASRRAPVTGATATSAVAAATTTTAPSKAAVGNDANLAEADPSAFARLLNERLQRVVEDRACVERLERLMAEVGNEEAREESTEIVGTEVEVTSAPNEIEESAEASACKAMARLSVVSISSISTKAPTNETTTKPSVLRLPWADRLLAAAARVQHGQQEESAQAILEDHCSRIWDTSADRTPTSVSGSRGDAINTALLTQLPTFGKPSTQVLEAPNRVATVEAGEEEEDDCIHPPLLQESSSPLNATTTTPTTTKTSSSTRFDFHQQVNESQLADIGSVGHQTRFLLSPSAPDRGSTQRRSSSSSGGLVVGYYLCDDPVPYRSQWPSNFITLGQFKHLVPKKGTFRFFFKTTSDEFDSGVVHQEISNDNTVLPLWEGKVIAKVERVDVLQAEQ